MPSGSDRFLVITGGPGAGKTTLLHALAVAGYPIVPEAGRAIIREQEAIGGSAHHHGDRILYRELMLSRDMAGHADAASVPGPVFFDRGVPDLIGYSHLIGAPVPSHLRRAAAVCRYHRHVFVAPPWPEIYAGDGERRQDFAEAVATGEAIVAAYVECGYEPVTLPKAPVPDRVAFVEASVAAWGLATR
jgi:predicted ATPase